MECFVIMMNKIKKLLKYICNYKKNRDLLRMYTEEFTFPFYANDFHNCIQYTNEHTNSKEQILSSLIILVHSLEKGLATSEEFRLGFGQQKVLDIVTLCHEYIDKYSDKPFRIRYAVGVLLEYRKFHADAQYALSSEVQNAIGQIVDRLGIENVITTQTIQQSAKYYFLSSKDNFKDFALSRHSIRDFSDQSVSHDILHEVIKLAQQAPSACNRQSVRVYAVYDKAKIRQMVELQNHQRGFADNANPLLVLAFDREDWGSGEQWFGGYLDAGIYLMNLLYALHYYQVAAIPLNWYASLEYTQKLKSILGMPYSHIPIAFVACGYPKDDFKLVTSKRLPVEDVLIEL